MIGLWHRGGRGGERVRDGIDRSLPISRPSLLLTAASMAASDAFVTKLSPAGNSLVYSTYLGGSGDEYGYGIAVDGAGSAYVTGQTYSSDFPTATPFDGSLNGDL